MDIKVKIEEIVRKITARKAMMDEFEKNPASVIEEPEASTCPTTSWAASASCSSKG